MFGFPEVLAVYSGTNLYYRKGGRKEGREEGRKEGRKEGRRVSYSYWLAYFALEISVIFILF